MNAPRKPRDLESRAKETREAYTPPSLLPTPNPEPGFSFRWVATHVLGEANPVNMSKRLREGWEPVKAEDHPELMLGQKTGNVEIGGLMLVKIPSERVAARAEFYNGQAQRQMDSVDNSFMAQNDPRMPKFNRRKTSVSRSGFGTGN